MIGEQNKYGVQFFFRTVVHGKHGPAWKSAQNHKNLNISCNTNAITMKLYANIALRKIIVLQEISRPEILHTLIYGPERKLRFWPVKSSEIIFCDPNSVP